MDTAYDHELIAALLQWQAELGADEALGEAPVNRYDLPAEAARPAAVAKAERPAPAAPPPATTTAADPVELARSLAEGADDLDALAAVQAEYEHCDLRRGAQSFVFSDGRAGARVMILGEAPGRDEDLQGKPFVGRAGQLLDRMFAAIGMGRDAPDIARALYISNILPWRPPGNRNPAPGEMAMMLPFVRRHVELVAPDVLILMGNTPCSAILGQHGITRLRGKWTEALGRPVLPMFHPAYLLRNPHAKRQAWEDLLALQARLREGEGNVG